MERLVGADARRMPGRGYTLVELTVAASVGVVVVGIALALLIQVMGMLLRSDERTDPRESGCAALAVVREALVNSIGFRIRDDGNRIGYVTSKATSGEVFFDPARKVVKHRRDGRRPDDLCAGVKALSFASVGSGIVRVRLELERPGRGRAGPGRVVLVDEVLVPCTACVDGTIPYQLPPLAVGVR